MQVRLDRVRFFRCKTIIRPEPGPSYFFETQTLPEIKKTRPKSAPIRVGSGRKLTELGFIVILKYISTCITYTR